VPVARSEVLGGQRGGGVRDARPALIWKAIFNPDRATARVELIGVDPIAQALLGNPEIPYGEWSTFLAVRVVSDDPAKGEQPPPVLGSYSAANGVIRFEPRFPLEPGVRFRAEFDPVQMHAVVKRHLVLCGFSDADWEITFTTKLTADFSLPPTLSESVTKVVDVFPSGSILPENLLRFYIHFSAPMSRGEAYTRVHLLDANERPVDDPFLELAEELWSHDGMRFTLLFDPGRIKQGLKPREDLGPVLEAGKAYTLVVDGEWLDARGRPLGGGFRKSFRAGPADKMLPDPKNWKIEPPQARTRDAFEVRFPEALDRALVDRLIAVENEAGGVVPGRVSTADHETLWRFAPREPWGGGNYRLTIGTDLEDIAGNSVARPFEVDVVHKVTAQVRHESVSLPFQVGSPAR
jgi:hypothetical protein